MIVVLLAEARNSENRFVTSTLPVTLVSFNKLVLGKPLPELVFQINFQKDYYKTPIQYV